MENNPENTASEPTKAEQLVSEFKEFFNDNGSPEEINSILWNMLESAITDPVIDYVASERAQMMFLYRNLYSLLVKAKELI